MIENKLLAAIQKEEDDLIRIVFSPSEGDMFKYGKSCGVYAGFQIVKRLINDILRGEEDEERKS